MRLLRSVVAGFALLALLAGFVTICPCSTAAASPGTHQCCKPATALRAADDGCCLSMAKSARDVASTPEPCLLLGPAVSALLGPLAAAGFTSTVPVRAALPAASPPRILRI